MFIAMNRFRVNAGKEDDFEAGWRGRQSHLKDFEGFLSFALLRGESANGITEYISHTTWRSRDDFESWRRSQAFTQAHAQGSVHGILAGPPVAGLYDAVIEEVNPKGASRT